MNQVKKAVILAAGMGLRLQPITNSMPKCLVEINGQSLLHRSINALEIQGFEEVIIVTGFKHKMIEKAVNEIDGSIRVKTIHNEIYHSTNNIYSLWLVNEAINESFALLESDLIVEDEIYQSFTQPDRIALDKYDSQIHSGTTVTLNEYGMVDQMFIKQNPTVQSLVYKTVNIYSFSKETWTLLKRKIDGYVENGDVNIFYEVALNDLIISNQIKMEIVDFSNVMWDEIDSISDYERVLKNMSLEYTT